MRLALPPIMLPMLQSKHPKPLAGGPTGAPTAHFGSLLEKQGGAGAGGGQGGGPPHPHGHGGRSHSGPDDPAAGHKPRKAAAEAHAMDPAARQAAHLAPPPALGPAAPLAAPTGAEAVATRARTSLEDLLPSLVRKVAWSGDGRRGAVHLELGGGPLAGGRLLIHAEDGRVRVHLTAPDGVAREAWRERIASRLAARGLVVDQVDVE